MKELRRERTHSQGGVAAEGDRGRGGPPSPTPASRGSSPRRASAEPDLAQATVFYSVLAGADADGAREGLNSAAGRIQAAVGAQTRLKRTPRLRFEPDPVVEQVSRIENAEGGKIG